MGKIEKRTSDGQKTSEERRDRMTFSWGGGGGGSVQQRMGPVSRGRGDIQTGKKVQMSLPTAEVRKSCSILGCGFRRGVLWKEILRKGFRPVRRKVSCMSGERGLFSYESGNRAE